MYQNLSEAANRRFSTLTNEESHGTRRIVFSFTSGVSDTVERADAGWRRRGIGNSVRKTLLRKLGLGSAWEAAEDRAPPGVNRKRKPRQFVYRRGLGRPSSTGGIGGD